MFVDWYTSGGNAIPHDAMIAVPAVVLRVIIGRLVSGYDVITVLSPSLSSSPIRCRDEVVAVLSPSPLPLASYHRRFSDAVRENDRVPWGTSVPR
jgi:hypothetical protein